MSKKKSSENRVGGISINGFTFPLLAIVIILHIVIIILILDVNKSSSDLSQLMEQSGVYQLEARNLQGVSMTLSDTCTNYVQRAGTVPVNALVQPLGSYVISLQSDSYSTKVLERFRNYDVSPEVLSYIEQADEVSQHLVSIQLHAISLVNSVYPFPEETIRYASIPLVELTEEELAMSPEQRIALAKNLMLDRDYAQSRYFLSDYVDQCINTLQEEFHNELQAAERHVAIVRIILWVAVLLIIMVLTVTFILFYTWIVSPVRKYSHEIDNNKRIEPKIAITELKQLVLAHNNLWKRRNKLETLLRAEAKTDALTKLPNRFSMQSDLIDNESYRGSLGVLLFDVNFLKHTNDTKGHLAGDQLIRTAANCIKECFANDAADNCYRIGGDEFVVFLKGITENELRSKIKAFESALDREKISVSVGYAYENDTDSNSFNRLMEKADRQMYEHKRMTHDKTRLAISNEVRREISESSLDILSSAAKNNNKINKYDYLTGLPNITYFFDIAELGREVISEHGGQPALLYFDLSGMKFYNHKYGFAEGDNMLRGFASLLSKVFDPENCGHIAGDHFVVLSEESAVKDKLETLFKEWDKTKPHSGLPICVGIYPNWNETIPVGIAYDRSKIACDALKGSYSSCYNYYNSKLNDAFVKQQYILENFDKALENNWIQVYYQPIMRAINKKVCDEEALARWIDPEKGVLSPADFIPHLEDTGLIYKLDLFVLERVLENMNTQKEAGLYIVPHSINISRHDFDACDIVEEVRKRVDAAGIGRDKISIEITESVIGREFDFMKEQIDRFRSLGFPVWIDDFGSGYSSLSILQSVKFDLIKFDMNFMRKLDENEDGRIILTDLMKMANALGVDTICEGVETEEQSRFLQEIGCSKLQGYYYSKPIPFEEAMKWRAQHLHDGYENPDESDYYESICGVNLFDLGVIALEEENSLKNAYSTLPMCIIEVKDDTTRFLRTNQSYRDFFKRFFKIDLSTVGPEFVKFDAAFMFHIVKNCCEQGLRSFYDEKMPDGSVVHSFARRIGVNPITGNTAVAIAVLSISQHDEGTTYVDIARALASDYYCMYVVDLDTDHYIEYSSPVGGQAMAIEKHGEKFFDSSVNDSYRIYEKDREAFFNLFNKEKIVQILDEQGVFTATYRLVDTGTPVWVTMKLTRLQPYKNKIILGVSIIDSQMKEKEQNDD